MNKKLMMMTTVALAAAVALAAPKKKPVAVADEDAPTTGKEAKITIDQFPKLGRQSTLDAPSISGGSTLAQCWTGKPRKWIVLEAKYTTEARCTERLTFAWHVLLDTKTCTNKDKEGAAKLAPYSYFTQTVTYQNIPHGSHAASVCLHPSYLERFGEPKAIGLVMIDANGEVIGGDTVSDIKGIAPHSKFWDDDNIMSAKTSAGNPMIERRQGLLDRSKTIWAMVNPNDYEQVAQ